MPSMQPSGGASGPAITGFAGKAIKIDGVARAGAVILTPEAVIDWDGEGLEPAITDPLPEFILLGTGVTLVQPDPHLVADFDACGIGIEAMDTRAAARVWTLLRSEGRWISAALRPL